MTRHTLRYTTMEHAGEHYPVLNGVQWGYKFFKSREEALRRARTAAGARMKTILKRNPRAEVAILMVGDSER